jgi:RNA polymerase sigma-70 factor (ECF subfamily)
VTAPDASDLADGADDRDDSCALRDDTHLLERFRRGERDALELVYRQHAGEVWAALRSGFAGAGGPRIVGLANPSALRDAVQDIFIRAFRESARIAYDGLRPYRPYLLRIARNVRIDELRRTGREVLMADPTTDGLGDAQGAPPEDAADQLHWEQQNALTRAHVATLDPEQQRYVDLRFVQELSQQQVAERMSLTRRKARTLESQVLHGLRKALARRGFP